MRTFDDFIMRDFQYGKSDCCQFVARCVEEMTGINHAEKFRYSDEDGAASILERHGGLDGLMTDVFGESVSEPMDGYIALVDQPELIGVVWRGRIVARTPKDINDIPLDRAHRFWNPWLS